ncbi:hypothetical protein ONE63_011079 [Megalurothrips usitatus]|uniref:Uncharacterized protein n=1 Tax=Megalurothrips usitatus TaxID=439358 RepID=A0AAV7XEY3_9NEOP|nr:hypothetical protein ONE63_011079 [Megalurothrips usitatus]
MGQDVYRHRAGDVKLDVGDEMIGYRPSTFDDYAVALRARKPAAVMVVPGIGAGLLRRGASRRGDHAVAVWRRAGSGPRDGRMCGE